MKKQLLTLVGELSTLDPDTQNKLHAPVNNLFVSIDKRDRLMKSVRYGIAALQLDMKYILFDLEATKRERDDALEKLEALQ